MATTEHLPLTAQQRQILSFLAQSRYLYDFLDANLIGNYQEANSILPPIIARGWAGCSFEEGAMLYKLTDLGRAALQNGLQLSEMPTPTPNPFRWLENRQ
ncbi:MAG: hypothetical protein KME15_20215 [Drouetiella hepatica Uher 2000/2452]|jgi:hypothetical protein|uniref:Uncharacterized protein n=1 Tax=Drouetiella hepatica Uher 2000/2452 TaxID=904376 RepID=A0A951QGX6_9CYAN|nr:hypothetical protein [Drouetiella hepatica Uher 2000/2452]